MRVSNLGFGVSHSGFRVEGVGFRTARRRRSGRGGGGGEGGESGGGWWGERRGGEVVEGSSCLADESDHLFVWETFMSTKLALLYACAAVLRRARI